MYRRHCPAGWGCGGQKWLCCRRNHSAKLCFSFFTLDKLHNVIKLDLLHCSLTSGKLHLWFLVQWKGANYLFKCSFNVLQWHKAWTQLTACPNLPEVSPWLLTLLSLFHFSSAPSLCPSKAPAVCRSCSWINPQCCLLQLALFQPIKKKDQHSAWVLLPSLSLSWRLADLRLQMASLPLPLSQWCLWGMFHPGLTQLAPPCATRAWAPLLWPVRRPGCPRHHHTVHRHFRLSGAAVALKSSSLTRNAQAQAPSHLQSRGGEPGCS